VLLLKKLGDALLPQLLFALRVLREHGLRCVVERDVYDRLSREDGFGDVETFYADDAASGALAASVDFVVCLGGDGVILHASSLFCGPAPPLLSFNLGSLGFLTSHSFESFREDIQRLLACDGRRSLPRVAGANIALRMRMRCELFRKGVSQGVVGEVLNEVVVNRGNNPFLTKIECFERNRLITKVQADGVIIATPTGSTAYSAAAGGSMVHPCIPALLFTPVCPHSLSFRPVLLPDSAELTLRIPESARDSAWVSFDGKRRHELRRGDSVTVRMSDFPLPTISKSDQTDDWFESLGRCLQWNERLEQAPAEPGELNGL
jgi:NAD+ kinase